MRNWAYSIVLALATLVVSGAVWSAGEEDQALIKAMTDAKVTLQQGLAASEPQGRPISAKFELEDGKLQLSVYTQKDGKFSEVIVDHGSGKVAKSEPITTGDDLAHAQAQSSAMAKAAKPLQAAIDNAVRGEAGSRAISITPDVKDGRAVASIVLLKGSELKTVEQSLN